MDSPKFNTKTAKVKAYLEAGNTITSWEAINLFKCTRLSAVIFNLINEYDMPIDSKRVYEDGTNYSIYWLTADPKVKEEIKSYLLRGNGITEEQALDVWGIKYLKVVLQELHDEGMNIVSKKVRHLCGEDEIMWFCK